MLECFDAFVIGLTVMPAKQTFGFFNKNLVMEYDLDRGVANGVNVDFEVSNMDEGGNLCSLMIFENTGDNAYALRWNHLLPGEAERKIITNLDRDGRKEIVTASYFGSLYRIETASDNGWEIVNEIETP